MTNLLAGHWVRKCYLNELIVIHKNHIARPLAKTWCLRFMTIIVSIQINLNREVFELSILYLAKIRFTSEFIYCMFSRRKKSSMKILIVTKSGPTLMNYENQYRSSQSAQRSISYNSILFTQCLAHQGKT